MEVPKVHGHWLQTVSKVLTMGSAPWQNLIYSEKKLALNINGIKQQPIAPSILESNGATKRSNRSVMEMVRLCYMRSCQKLSGH